MRHVLQAALAFLPFAQVQAATGALMVGFGAALLADR